MALVNEDVFQDLRMMAKETFLLSVGCQKDGTTWLFNDLRSHPMCDLGFTEEYHISDALIVKKAGKTSQRCSRKQPVSMHLNTDKKIAVFGERTNVLLYGECNETGVVQPLVQDHVSKRIEPRPNLMSPAVKAEMQHCDRDACKALVEAG